MQILEKREAFGFVRGRFQFLYTVVILGENDSHYIAKSADRRPGPTSSFYEKRQLVVHDRGPVLEPQWTTLPSCPPGCFIKTPAWFAYDGTFDLEQQILREVRTCEILRRNPHPNLATYLGCIANNGRVSGIIFERYAFTLQEKVNPNHLSKQSFISGGRPLIDHATKACLEAVKSAIDHLHSLGLTHNDITPSNIMYNDKTGVWVVTDFDSCRHIGESIRDTQTKRTHGWFMPDTDLADQRNDHDALLELRTWLLGPPSSDFLFGSA